MGYYIDLASISIDAYKEKLRNGYLPPSRMILKEQLDERFDCFKGLGIENVKELLLLLKKSGEISELVKLEYFTIEYLKILLREINSTLPKPNKVKEFLGISEDTVARLEKLGIKTSLHLYEKVKTVKSRQEISNITGIDNEIILELTKLCDLSRIKWVGVTFAKMLYDIGIDTVEKATKADAIELHKSITKINTERNYYKGKIGLNDIQIFVNAAKEVSLDIKY